MSALASAADPPSRPLADQLAWEIHRRQRLGVLTLASGVLFEISSNILAAVLGGAPTVGLVQSLAPALNGIAKPASSPRTAEIAFIGHHAFGLIAGGVVEAVSLTFASLALVFLFQATRYRRPRSLAAALYLVAAGGVLFGLLSVVHEVILAVGAHNFDGSSNHTIPAADRVLSTGTAVAIDTYLNVLVALLFAIGVAVVAINAMRVGLITRMLGYVGVLVAFLFVVPFLLPSFLASLITAFWLVSLGVIYIGRWPGGDPPAWAAGQAIPWPSGAEQRASRGAPARGGLFGRRLASAAAAEAPPEPIAPPSTRAANRRKRRRGGKR